MNIIECINEYINKVPNGVPIFTNDIYNYVAKRIENARRDIVNTNITRYQKVNENLIRYSKGIYYKSVDTPFGKSGIKLIELVKRKYIRDLDNIIGYETGPFYINKIGLNTQMPAHTYIATNRFTSRPESNIILIKPVINISNDNYKYLQFLDVLDNPYNINFEAKDYKEILRNYIEHYKLNYEQLLYFAKFYKNNNIYKRLAELARGI